MTRRNLTSANLLPKPGPFPQWESRIVCPALLSGQNLTARSRRPVGAQAHSRFSLRGVSLRLQIWVSNVFKRGPSTCRITPARSFLSLPPGRRGSAGSRGTWLNVWKREGVPGGKQGRLTLHLTWKGTVPNTGALTLRPRSPANQEAEKPHEEAREAKVQPNRVIGKQRNKQESSSQREKLKQEEK